MASQRELTTLYNRCHDLMRNIDGLQPQEAFDELLKYLFFREVNEEVGPAIEDPEFALAATGTLSTKDKQTVKQIRDLFGRYMAQANTWIQQLWPNKKLHLSDPALIGVHRAFGGSKISDIPIDIRSVALKDFLTPELRKGLGIFLTPDAVVRAAVEIANPHLGDRILDPACGSGTFLIEAVRLLQAKDGKKSIAVYGVDKSPRMLLLADLNLGHDAKTTFTRKLADSLFDLPNGERGFAYDSFDLIVTNPPFGVYLEHVPELARRFETCVDERGISISRQQSEVVFVEQCLRLLRPGGLLAIVLPKSVLTNSIDRTERARSVFDKLGYLICGFSLPPETFAVTGTQTTTAVLFIKKYEKGSDLTRPHRVAWIDITNVGYDTTGRNKGGSELESLPKQMKTLLGGAQSNGPGRLLPEVPIGETFRRLPKLLSSAPPSRKPGIPLGDLLELARTGRTPARSAYKDDGLFVLKVGNLTGKGIDWAARERNFVSKDDQARRDAQGLLLKSGDLVLTSSAHSPVYIGKKVDIVMEIPSIVGGIASVVGEVMLLRPKPKTIDPFLLLAFFRAPETTDQLQRMVRGQTAHLHSDDVLELIVPKTLVSSAASFAELKRLLEEEAELAMRKSQLHFRQFELICSLLGGNS